jgi:hypothetical protein
MEASDERTRWIAAGAGAVGVLALLLLLFRIPESPATMPSVPAESVLAIADASASNAALREATQMHDLAPLFLPTELNAKLKEVPRPEPGRGVFDVEPTKLSFPASGLQVTDMLPAAVTLNGKAMTVVTPVDALAAMATGPSLAGFGRAEAPLTPVPSRGGFLEVVASGTGERILVEVLPMEAMPVTQKPWQPPQFLAVLDAAGLVGPLRVTEGSRVEEVDRHYQDFLVQKFRLGERLGPGFYRVTVGP